MQLVAGIAGAVVGFAIGGPAGAQAGFALASAAYGLFGPKPAGPGPGDLKRPQLTIGAQIARVYGRTRRPVHVVWASDFRASEVEQGSKGPPEGPSSYTYSLDLLGWIADGDNVIAVTRIWVNNKLYYTALSDSTAESIAASAATPQWDDFEFLPGAGAQTPWAVYEDAVGASDAPAYRGVASIGFENFQCGSTKQVPFIEAEVITAGTVISVPIASADVALPRATNGGGDFSGHSSSGWYLDDTSSATATGSIWLAYWYFERITSFPVESYTVTVTVGGVGVWSQTLNWADGEVTKAVAVQFNTPVAHTPITVSWSGDHFGEFYYGFYGTDGATVWQSILADGQFVESTDPAFGISTDGAGNYRRMDVDYPTANIWGTNSFYIDNATPATVDLADIVDAELARVPGLDPSDWDSSDLVGVEVTGFTAIGSAAQALGDLGDIYHFDLVPGAPMRFVRRAAATVGSIAFNDTGSGVGAPGEPFTGLRIGNNDESPAVVGLGYPNIAQDHDVDFQSGDRLTTDGPDIRRVQTNVVLTPAEARGRAFSATVMQRSAAKTAGFGISDAYAAAEPGDAYAVTDIDGNAYNLRIKRLSYADGVKQCEWELNDISALVDELETETDYEEAITVAPAGTATLLLVDGPLLRDADDGPGFYAAITIAGDGGATFYGSTDDVTYSAIATVSRSATTGACTALGDWTGGWTWDEVNTVTVTLAVGSSTLASSTHAAMYADESVNAALIGAHGRWELVRFRNATLIGTRTYVLSGLLRGGKGTEFAIGDHEAGDSFVLLADNGILRVTQLADEIGVLRYFKAVPDRRAVASVAGQPFTCDSECLEPRAVVDIRVVDGVLTWDRRTRLSAPPVGEPPLGEASESYDVELLDGSDVVLVSDTVAEPQWPMQEIVLTHLSSLAEPGHTFKVIGAEVVSISDPLPLSFLGTRRFVRHNAAGGVVAFSDSLGHEVTQWVNNGDTLYAVAQTFSPAHPNPYASSKVLRYSRTSIGTAAATNTASVPGDYQGVAFDGTDIWVSERDSGNLRRLDASTLVSAASYAVAGPGPLVYAGGDLLTVCIDSSELVRWDIGTTAELYREPCIDNPFDLLVTGSLVFVLGYGELGIYNLSDGSEVSVLTSAEYGRYARPGRNLAVIDGNVIVIGSLALSRFDASTGAFVDRIALDDYADDVWSVSELDGELCLCIEPVVAGSSSLVVRRYEFDATALTAAKARVYQNSAVVGRGHVAELTL
jgi:hypothetical protein